MHHSLLDKYMKGYQTFREKYVSGNTSLMSALSANGQRPTTMVIGCSDSRVDPSVILQCDPGELFVIRNVANIIPPFESNGGYHGTSAALEFGINYLNIKEMIILGHSQCGGIHALVSKQLNDQSDFIEKWVSIVNGDIDKENWSVDDYAKQALICSYQNCLTFPWISDRLKKNLLTIHQWYFDIHHGELFIYDEEKKLFRTFE
ncbi:carbonic anhydrase [bacterium]|nr:carbonic anhydrase [bacterium]NBW57968.1 carbonic anhydrase [bacterium]NBX72602.1 carbonic anhydrase [bacterium]